jgi:hypothetical protein
MTNANPITNAAPDQSTSPTSALWRIVLSEYQSAVAEYEEVSEKYEAAMNEHDAAMEQFTDRRAEFAPFEPIRPEYPDNTIRLVFAKLAWDRRESDPAAPMLNHVEALELWSKAAQIVTDYAKLQEEVSEVVQRLDDSTEQLHDVACDKVTDAREKLLATPAPDAAALFYKLDILNAYLAECDSEDKERVAAVAADVRRLFDAA